jgi:hypothetical protein
VKLEVLPWYVAGFLLTGLAVTIAGYLPEAPRTLIVAGTKQLVQPANLLIGTSMAAIGLQVDFVTLKKHGPKLMLLPAAPGRFFSQRCSHFAWSGERLDSHGSWHIRKECYRLRRIKGARTRSRGRARP